MRMSSGRRAVKMTFWVCRRYRAKRIPQTITSITSVGKGGTYLCFGEGMVFKDGPEVTPRDELGDEV